jgi:hypothetical protein
MERIRDAIPRAFADMDLQAAWKEKARIKKEEEDAKIKEDKKKWKDKLDKKLRRPTRRSWRSLKSTMRTRWRGSKAQLATAGDA